MFKNKNVIKLMMSFGVSILSFYITSVLADLGGTTANIGTIAENVTGTLGNVVKLLTAGAYMAGFGLTIASLFKFKQHKENPQQTQLATCIVMLLVGVGLIFLPSIIKTGGATIFGSATFVAGTTGITSF